MCIFCKIVNKELPSSIILETDDLLAFHDIKPHAPVHVLAISKKHIDSFHTASGDILKKISEFSQDIAVKMGIDKSGYRIITNIGDDGGQEVKHLHLHILGGKKLNF